MNEQNQNEHMAVYEIPVLDIAPNPYQPRLEFDDTKLSSMADSIVRYGVMQPIVVTKKPDGKYELISGERRLRGSKLAGKETIPAVVRDYEHSDEEKFELAIIENIQREDLSPVDKAKAFEKLSNQFGYTHSEIAQKMGKSREYISNALRLLLLPDEILYSMGTDVLTEGHARPLLMLKDRPYEQGELFKKIISQKLTVRAAEKIARSIATEKLRKLDIEKSDPEIKVMEKKLAEKLGTKVHIDEKTVGEGGKLTIEYFSKEDLEKIINLVKGGELSNAPVLESNTQGSGINRFKNNFSNEEVKKVVENNSIGKQALQSTVSASVFAEEIEGLVESKDIESQKETVKISLENDNQSEDNIDGYNITFGTSPRTEVAEEIVVEKIPEKDNFIAAEPSIDNFETSDWRERQKEDDYQKDLKNIIEQQNSLKNVEEKIEPEVPAKKHDITELTLDSHLNEKTIEETNFAEKSKVEEIKREQPFSKADFMMQVRERQVEQSGQNSNIASESQNVKSQNFSEKTEAQKRIDDILAGRKTVSEEYGIEKKSVENLELPIVNQEKMVEEDIEDGSVYQQFLESKKKIEDQKSRMFSGEDDNKINNIGSFAHKTSDFTNNVNAHSGNENSYVADLNQEREVKEALYQVLEENRGSENNNVEVGDIMGGGSFIPEKKVEVMEESLDEDRVEPPKPVNEIEDKYSFKGFSI